jgi:hypothetical protein
LKIWLVQFIQQVLVWSLKVLKATKKRIIVEDKKKQKIILTEEKKGSFFDTILKKVKVFLLKKINTN